MNPTYLFDFTFTEKNHKYAPNLAVLDLLGIGTDKYTQYSEVCVNMCALFTVVKQIGLIIPNKIVILVIQTLNITCVLSSHNLDTRL